MQKVNVERGNILYFPGNKVVILDEDAGTREERIIGDPNENY